LIATDENGEYRSRANEPYTSSDNANVHVLHTYETNANDRFLEQIDAGEVIKYEDLTKRAGTWFGLSEFGSMAAADDSLGAFPYGKYRIQEVRTDTNEGYNLINFTFYVHVNTSETDDSHADVIDLSNLRNVKVTVDTELTDQNTGMHISAPRDKAKLVDNVAYSGLYHGHDYIFKGKLVDQETGVVYAEKQMTRSASNLPEDMKFSFDATACAGKNVVAYEEVYDAVPKSADELIYAGATHYTYINNYANCGTSDSELTKDEINAIKDVIKKHT
jgi:hypothetical protein